MKYSSSGKVKVAIFPTQSSWYFFSLFWNSLRYSCQRESSRNCPLLSLELTGTGPVEPRLNLATCTAQVQVIGRTWGPRNCPPGDLMAHPTHDAVSDSGDRMSYLKRAREPSRSLHPIYFVLHQSCFIKGVTSYFLAQSSWYPSMNLWPVNLSDPFLTLLVLSNSTNSCGSKLQKYTTSVKKHFIYFKLFLLASLMSVNTWRVSNSSPCCITR